MMSEIKVIDVSLPTENGEDLVMQHILPVIRPKWEPRHIRRKVLTGGYANSSTRYSLDSDENLEDAVVVRVILSKVEIKDERKRTIEFAANQIGHYAGCFPPLLATFENGFVYGYARGRNVNGDEHANPTIARLIARCLAQFHWTDVNKLPLIDIHGHAFQMPTDFVFFSHIRSGLEAIRQVDPNTDLGKRLQAELPPITWLEKEVDYIEATLSEAGLTRGLCHRDPHHRNLVYDEEHGKMTLLDYDGIGYGFLAFDFSYMSNMYLFHAFSADFPFKPLSEGEKIFFVRSYLERKYEVEGRQSSDIPAREVDLLLLEIKIMDAVMPFLYKVNEWCMLPIKGDYAVFYYFQKCMDLYSGNKKELERLCEEFKKLKAT